MTKWQHVLRSSWRVFMPAYLIAGVMIAFLVVLQVRGVALGKEFWIALYAALGCLSVFFIGLLIHRVRCPDCRKSVALWCRSRYMSRCPKCGADWTAEMT